MKRRPTASGRRPHKRRQKTASGIKLKATRHRRPSTEGQGPNAAQLVRERDEALEQLSATSDVLRVISSSPGELRPVFEAMLTSAMRICEAKFGHLLLYDGESYHAAHLHNLPPGYHKIWEQGPIRLNPELALGRLPHTKQAIQITDLKAEPSYGDKLRVASVELGGARTLLAVPMLKENHFVGAIA